MRYRLTHRDIKRIERAEKRKEVLKDVGVVIAFAILFLVAAAIGGTTFPY